MERFPRELSCCFTGHRPEKLQRSEEKVISALEEAIGEAVGRGFVTFISGMSRGVDIWAAEIILRYRDEGRAVSLICAPPFEGTEKSWKKYWREKYTGILSRADEVVFAADRYTGIYLYQRRDEWMVDNSSLVIAVYDGERGGTRNTIEYALSNGVEVQLI